MSMQASLGGVPYLLFIETRGCVINDYVNKQTMYICMQCFTIEQVILH